MDSLFQTLPEVMVTGERPIVKAEAGKLVYDLPRLISEKPVSNVYEAIRELPGVTESNGSFQLGGRGVHVVLDGKVTTLSSEQLATLLKSMPASRIKSAEVMYNAPARYQVRGALINITLNKQTDGASPIQGELYGKIGQDHETTYQQRASLLFNKGNFSADFLYSHEHGRQYRKPETESRHYLETDGKTYDIITGQVNRYRYHEHNFRLGADYNFAEQHRLSLVYNGQYSPSHTKSEMWGNVVGNSAYDQKDILHNLRADYELPIGLKTGVEFTYYKAPSTQTLDSRMADSQMDYLIHDNQHINKWKGFISGEHDLKNNWSVNYGVIYANTLDNSFQYYTKTNEASVELPADKAVRKREQRLDLYGGFSKSFSDKLTLDASLDVEHYQTPVWDKWNLYPSLNLSYQPNSSHLWQLALSSGSTYPDYWSVAAYTSYMNGGYAEIQGNPTLKPMNDYQAQLVYMLHSKYMLVLWYDHQDDYFTQTLYQRPDKLVLNYKFLNSDFNDQVGMQVTIPVKPFKWWDARINLVGVYNRQKDSDFYDLPYDRKKIWSMLNVRNTLTLSKKPDLTLQVNGMVRTTAIQGTYDLPPSGNLDLLLRYRFLQSRAQLTFFANNVLETNGINPRIRYKGQWIDNRYSDYRTIGVSFTYSFGGYKAKQREAVDTSRFK